MVQMVSLVIDERLQEKPMAAMLISSAIMEMAVKAYSRLRLSFPLEQGVASAARQVRRRAPL